MKFGTLRVFEVADYESELKIPKIKIADPICWIKCKKLMIGTNFGTRGFFGIADYKSEIKI